ncbi:putative inactive hydroxysteroid dehydrogenase-like protein 1, partial [Apostichopus japonicus]
MVSAKRTLWNWPVTDLTLYSSAGQQKSWESSQRNCLIQETGLVAFPDWLSTVCWKRYNCLVSTEFLPLLRYISLIQETGLVAFPRLVVHSVLEICKLYLLPTFAESTHGVQTLIIKADFGLGQEIYPSIADKLAGKEVGILVNNVGAMDYPQLFQEVPMERLWQLININIGAATLMSHLVLPKMAERKRGAIINISASASIYPNPQLAVYAACK